MDFTNTFLSQITLGRQFNAYECINYTGHWCEFCGEDNGGGKFCYECGKREEAEQDKYDRYDKNGFDDNVFWFLSNQ